MKSLYENILSKSNVCRLTLQSFNRNVQREFKKAFGDVFDLTGDDRSLEVFWFEYIGKLKKPYNIKKLFLERVTDFYKRLSELYKMCPLYQYKDADGPIVDVKFAEAPKEWQEMPTLTLGTIESDGKLYMRFSNYDEALYDMILGK